MATVDGDQATTAKADTTNPRATIVEAVASGRRAVTQAHDEVAGAMAAAQRAVIEAIAVGSAALKATSA